MFSRPFLGILLTAALVWTAIPSPAAHATSITVTTTADELNSNGNCSLREAVQAANTNAAVDACAAGQSDAVDTIVVPAGTYTLTLAGGEGLANNSVGDLDVLGDVAITGAGAATTIIQACDVDQQASACPAGHGIADRVFDVVDCQATISGVTVRRGRAGGNPGHGIFVRQFNAVRTISLALTDVVVTKNGTPDTNVFVTKGGGIAAENADVTLTRVTVSDNVLGGGGSGGLGAGIGVEGAVGSNGHPASLAMTDCTVTGNVAGAGGGGIYMKESTVADITSTTISGNTGPNGGGGVSVGLGVTGTMTNCTISGNQSNNSGAGVGISTAGSFNLRSCTITLNHIGNTSNGGAGLYAGAGVVLRNTIIAGNIHDATGPSKAPDCQQINQDAIVSEGHNILGEAQHCPSLVDGQHDDRIGTQAALIDAKLGPLANNGGPTLTHALLDGSPAIDTADPGVPGTGITSCPATDQRGEERPAGPACDVGAFERADSGAFGLRSVAPPRGGNGGTVLTHIQGSGFVAGATAKLVRDGLPDVIGTATNVRGSILTTSFDLRGATPGAWSVVVANPDQSTRTLADAFTVEVGGNPDLWADVLLPRKFNGGYTQSIYLVFGNRGTVDAYGVPIWIAFSNALFFHVRFPVTPPPAQPQQIATDWTRIGIDVTIPPPADSNSFPLLLPVVPAGSTGVLEFRVRSQDLLSGSPVFRVSSDIGQPYFEPDLSNAVVSSYVARAKEYAATAHGTTTFPSDTAIATYVRTQLADVVATASANAAAVTGGYAPVYSQAQLIVDTGQFIAGESATALEPAAAAPFDRHWLARVVSDLFVSAAEARLVNPDCEPGDIFCERYPTCATHPPLCDTEPPLDECDRIVLDVARFQFSFVPCNPKNDDRPYTKSHDPNDKVGPGGPGGFVDGLAPLPYTVSFENDKAATGDAFTVTVTDQLDTSKYDLATFSLGPITFGSTFVAVPPGLKSYTTEVDLRPAKNILVGIDAKLNAGTGVVTWKLTTLDPATHQFPENPDEGFLPPNVTQPEGEGAVLFTVSFKPGFPLGTTVCNDARIVFDFNAPIDTPEFCNTIGQPEDCENCIDDDGDGKIDRADPDCSAAANGAGAGVGDAAAGKAVDKCAKTIRKAADKIASLHLKQLAGCQKAVADCVQLKPGDAACLAQATAKCTKARDALPGADAKLTAAITKTCSDPTVTTANLFAATGLGFDGEVESCGRRGLAGVTTVADVAECVSRQHACEAERLLGAAVPRARELLTLGGLDPLPDLACVGSGANGGGAALAPEKRKAVRKCDAAIQKAATKLFAGRTKIAGACGGAVFACLQTKPGDASCVANAGGACTKAFAGFPKLTASFDAALAKACGAAPLAPADLLGADGIGAGALAARCKALGFASLDTVDDVGACLAKEVACRADQVLQTATPRIDELLELGGVTLP